MDHATFLALVDINRRFYTQHAEEFSNTRQAPWSGWKRIVDRLETKELPSDRLRVLDLGCGNGRFLRYLDRRGLRVSYAGVDLVVPSRAELASWELATEASWYVHDFIVGDDPLPAGLPDEFDLIVVFGALHHVPGFAVRERLLSSLVHRLAAGGLLVVTLWQFGAHERFRRRVIDWCRSEAVTGVPVDPQLLEPGDFLLAWGHEQRAARYCHHTTPSEWQALVADLELGSVDEFLADGSTQDLNAYRVVQRRANPRPVASAPSAL